MRPKVLEQDLEQDLEPGKVPVPVSTPPQKMDTSRSHSTSPQLYPLQLSDRNRTRRELL